MFRSKNRIAAAIVVGLAIAIVAAVGATHYARAKDSPAAAQSAAPAAVDVASVVSRRVIDWQTYSGRLEAVERVEIRPLVSGTLMAVHFKDGALVNKGDLLFTIDPRPYAAEVDRAQAQLQATEARAAYTAADLARGQRLLADNAIARRDFEEKQNAAREAAANQSAARAALAAAQLNLGYTRIAAPVAGQVSRAEVTVGNVVAAGGASQVLTTLVSVSRMYASFDVDEQSFLKYVNPGRVGKSGQTAVFLGLANENGFPREGRVSSVDNRLDTSSGTIRVRAVFDNPDGVLLPGLYARVRLGGGAARDALLIDEKAVGTDQDKRFVLVVDPTDHTAYREVKLGPASDGLRVVEQGLQIGDRIVVNGLQRTRPGQAVTAHMVPMASADATSLPATVSDTAAHTDSAKKIAKN
jgi:membrane fusion protein, multidrug efflux system